MIDLHSHTNESDGTFTPAELVDLAMERGIEALAISDHDTFAGFDQALPLARSRGLDLVCGIELSTRIPDTLRTVHLLAYFLRQPPPADFREWLHELIAGRRDRNQRIESRLVARPSPAKPLGQRRENMRGLSEQFARFRERLGR